MVDRAEVRNAADPQQVKRAGRRERDKRRRTTDALKATLATPAGRITLWTLLERAGIFGSIYRQSSEIYYLAGRQDFGHELLASILEADEDGYLLMEREAREWARRDNAAIDAAATPGLEEQEHNG